MTDTSPRFPSELLDLFIDTLGERPITESRHSTLATCSLVSRSFAHRSRRHTFYRVDTDLSFHRRGTETEYLTTFYELLTWTSSSSGEGGLTGIAPYIKQFRCWYDLGDGAEVEGLLAVIFQCLHGPEHGITLLDVAFNTSWKELGLGLRHALADLFRSPCLATLHITITTDLPRTLLIGSHIKHLLLYWCRLDDAPAPLRYSPRYPTVRNAHPQLETLDLEPCWSSAALLVNEDTGKEGPQGSALSALRVFKCCLRGFADFDSVVAILPRVENTVEYLKVHYGDSALWLDRPTSFDFTEMRKLHHLAIHLDMTPNLPLFFPNATNSDFFPIPRVPPNLLRLDVVLRALSRASPEGVSKAFFNSFTEPSEVERWSRLNRALSSSEFAGVKEVVVTLQFSSTMVHVFLDETARFVGRADASLRAVLSHFQEPKTLKSLSIKVQF
ncbi:hypothetical protein NLJ89_g7640 [Agrocybe chaxingu]|uniref:Uncharacterized protein n=1 Tax=Agrocybe chaxingu TaxID=84603 RepID=A0A9W8MUV2_9AGAR|nr:hypothetical protein NLJ89_g7640 [Agrocybe chaxingu]